MSNLKNCIINILKLLIVVNAVNCCKTLGISMDESELNEICKHYHLDVCELKNKVLTENYGEYTAQPCPFLNTDNSCQIKECLPVSCQDYPYTNKEERLFSLLTIVNNSKVCPVVYDILEDLKDMYHFKRKYEINLLRQKIYNDAKLEEYAGNLNNIFVGHFFVAFCRFLLLFYLFIVQFYTN